MTVNFTYLKPRIARIERIKEVKKIATEGTEDTEKFQSALCSRQILIVKQA